MGALYYRLSLKFVLTVIGIILAGALPALFSETELDFPGYISTIGSILSGIAHPDTLTYVLHPTGPPDERAFSLFPKILEPWRYSMTLLFASFFLAFLISLTMAYFTMLLSDKARRRIKFILFSFESVPDVLIIGIFSIVVIYIYEQTHILFFNIVNYGEDHAYTLPIIILTILPALLIYRTMILDFEEQMSEPYVDFAKTKGLETRQILFIHVFRNAFISIFQHSKFILWVMLSNLLLIEYVFNIHGLLFFIFNYFSPEALTVGLFLIFCPLFALQAITQLIMEKSIQEQVEV